MAAGFYAFHLVFLAWGLSSVEALASVKVLYDASNNLHRNINYHPEQPARIEACINALMHEEANMPSGVDIINVAETSSSEEIVHEPFTVQELDHARACLVQAHSEELVGSLETRCRSSRQRRIDEGKPPLGFVGYIDDDTYVTTETYDVCLRSMAAWIRAVDMALSDDKNTLAMALTRPPGHHATAGLSNGFCVFNFAAAAAIHALESDSSLRISVLDWDVHFGQGVAGILQAHPRARYVSIHQSPAFPYEGEEKKVRGEHENIYTIPIQAETTWSCGYKEVFIEEALPFVRTSDGDEWQPDLVIVCSGYDALDSDDLASVSLQAKDYGLMTKQLLQHLDGGGRGKRPSLMLGLEGGYQLSPMAGGGNLADAVVETVKALVDHQNAS